MSAAQWFALLAVVVIGTTCLVALVQEFRFDHQLRAVVDREEAEVDEWLRVARVVGVLDPGCPIYDRLVCDQIEEQEGWVA